MADRVFLDTSVLIRYLAEDDPPRAFVAASLIDGQSTIVISTGVLLEALHVLRTAFGATNPALGEALISMLSKRNVELADADAGAVVSAISRTLRVSARRIPDAIVAAAAEQAGCGWIATFDEGFASPSVPSRLL
jgi:predicted nucleic acid-binding protein